ncbi:WD40-repeat-containing domain protein [Phlyctochytrium arcticum]|nr:WD40-repeat-containing domain protein [Phlyctochytrium arcticum]
MDLDNYDEEADHDYVAEDDPDSPDDTDEGDGQEDLDDDGSESSENESHMARLIFISGYRRRNELGNQRKLEHMKPMDVDRSPQFLEEIDARMPGSIHRILKGREAGCMGNPTTVPLAKHFVPNKTTSVLSKYGARAYSGEFSGDGKFLFSCTQDFRVHLYDTSDISAIRKYRTIQADAGRWTITDCALSSDNRKLIYSSINPIIHMANAQADDPDQEQTALNFDHASSSHGAFGIWAIRFSGDDREIVAGTSHNMILVYDIERRQVLHEIPGHSDDVNAVCYAEPQSSHVIFSASDDSFVKVWDRRSLGRRCQPAGVLVGHTEGITYVTSKGDNRYLLTNGKDQQMKMWDIRYMMEPNAVAADPTLKAGYYGEEWDYRIMKYPGITKFRHPKDCSVQTFTGHNVLKTLIRCHFSPASTGQRYVYTGSEDGIVRIFSLDGTLVQSLDTSDALSGVTFDVPEDADQHYFENLRPRRSKCIAVTRDVSWHPELPCIVSTSWCGPRGAQGALVKHEYGESK